MKELTGADFHKTVDTSDYLIVDCYGDFCFACELLEPVFNGLAAKMPGLSFARINLTENMEIAEELQIFNLPTLLYYRKGQLVTSSEGSMDERMLKEYVAQLLYGQAD